MTMQPILSEFPNIQYEKIFLFISAPPFTRLHWDQNYSTCSTIGCGLYQHIYDDVLAFKTEIFLLKKMMIGDENGDDSVFISTYSPKQMPIQIQLLKNQS